MTEENKSLLKNKLINSLANIYIYSTCLSILTGCKVNMQTELTSKQPDNIIQDVGVTSSEDYQDSEEVDSKVADIPSQSLININGNTMIDRFNTPQG